MNCQNKIVARTAFFVFVSLISLSQVASALTWPMGEKKYITSGHGDFRAAIRVHKGVDIDGELGDPVKSSQKGQWEKVGASGTQWKIGDHYYRHLDSTSIELSGNGIEENVVFGKLGKYPAGTGGTEHLHFETGNDNPLFLYGITDTNNGNIGEIRFRTSGTKYETLEDGGKYSLKDSGEFIIFARDKSNSFNNIAFQKLDVTLKRDGSSIASFTREFGSVSPSDIVDPENTPTSPRGDTVYSVANPDSSYSNFYYRTIQWIPQDGSYELAIKG